MSTNTDYSKLHHLQELWQITAQSGDLSPGDATILLKLYQQAVGRFELSAAQYLQLTRSMTPEAAQSNPHWEAKGVRLLMHGQTLYRGNDRASSFSKIEGSLGRSIDDGSFSGETLMTTVRNAAFELRIKRILQGKVPAMAKQFSQFPAELRSEIVTAMREYVTTVEPGMLDDPLAKRLIFLTGACIPMAKDPSRSLHRSSWQPLLKLYDSGETRLVGDILHLVRLLPVYEADERGLLPRQTSGFLGQAILRDILGDGETLNGGDIEKRFAIWKILLKTNSPDKLKLALWDDCAGQYRLAFQHAPALLEKLLDLPLTGSQLQQLPLKDPTLAELTQDLPMDFYPVLALFGGRRATCRYSGSLQINPTLREQMKPFLRWIAQGVKKGGDIKLYGELLEKAVLMALFHSKVAPLVFALPENKMSLSCGLLTKTGFNADKMVAILNQHGLEDVVAQHVPWANAQRLATRLEAHAQELPSNDQKEQTKARWTMLVETLSPSQSSDSSLSAPIARLSAEQKKALYSTVELATEHPEFLEHLLVLVQTQPTMFCPIIRLLKQSYSQSTVVHMSRLAKECPEVLGSLMEAAMSNHARGSEVIDRLKGFLRQRRALENDALWKYWLLQYGHEATSTLRKYALVGAPNTALERARAILSIDTQHGTVFFAALAHSRVDFSKVPDRLLKDLRDNLQFRRNFNRFFSCFLKGPNKTAFNLARMVETYPKHAESIQQILGMTSGHRAAAIHLMNELYENSRMPLILGFGRFCKAFSKRTQVREDLLCLMDRGDLQLVKWILHLVPKSNDFAAACLDMARVSDLGLVKDLVDLARKKISSPVVRKAVQLAGSEHAAAVNVLLDWKRSRPYPKLLKEICPDAFTDGLSPLHQQILMLGSRGGDEDFLAYLNSDPDKQQGWVREWLAKGHVELAKYIWKYGRDLPKRFRHIDCAETLLSLITLCTEDDSVSSFAEFQIGHHRDPKRRRELAVALTFLAAQDRKKINQLIEDRRWSDIEEDINTAPRSLPKRFFEAGFKTVGALLRELNLKRHPEELALHFTRDLSMIAIGENGSVMPAVLTAIRNELSAGHCDFIDKEYMIRALDTVRKDSDICMRIAQCQVPAPGSQSYRLIQHSLGLSFDVKLTQQHLSQALLTSLLLPLRQGRAGSCFATAKIIQQRSHRWGLRQVLEDQICLIETGQLKRRNGPTQWTRAPLHADDLAKEGSFRHDFLLSRAHEYTMATFASIRCTFHHDAMQKLYGSQSDLSKRLRHGIGIIDNEQRKLVCDRITQLHKKTLAERTETAYLGYLRRPGSSGLGGWMLMSDGGRRRISELPDYRKIHLDTLKTVEETVSDQFDEHRKAIAQAFYGPNGLIITTRSGDFGDMLLSALDRPSGQARINPETQLHRSKDNPWIRFRGGHTEALDRVVDERPEAMPEVDWRPKDGEELLTCVMQAIAQLPLYLKKSLAKEPQQKLRFCCPGHRFTLLPHAIMKLGNRKGGSSKLIEEMKATGQRWSTTVMSTALFNESIQWLRSFKAPRALAEAMQNRWSGIQDKTMANFAQVAEEELAKLGLGQKAIDQMIFQWDIALRRKPELADRRPDVQIFGDTNWNRTPHFAFTTDVYGKIIPVGTSGSSKQPNISLADKLQQWGWRLPMTHHVLDAYTLAVHQPDPVLESEQQQQTSSSSSDAACSSNR